MFEDSDYCPAEEEENESFQDEKAVREFARECREDGFMPMLEYDEFEDLLKDRGMTPTQDLYQIYITTYENGTTEEDLERVRKEFESILLAEAQWLIDNQDSAQYSAEDMENGKSDTYLLYGITGSGKTEV